MWENEEFQENYAARMHIKMDSNSTLEDLITKIHGGTADF